MDLALQNKLQGKQIKREPSSVAMHCLERTQKIYDAVHGFIRFNSLERMLIDSEPFQRLHHIHQLGISYIVYPGATHTRFEHSLGTMELSTRILEKICSKKFNLPDAGYWMQIIRLAALCHDLGHLPFSHDAEKVLLGEAGHEGWTMKAIESQHLKPIWKELKFCFPERNVVNDILKMAIGKKKLLEMGVSLVFSPVENVLSQVVTGDFFGADRIDYLLRDAQCTGVSYGLFDYHQLIEMLCVLCFEAELQLGIEENGIESCEALLLARHFMHQRVYQYSSVKAYKFHLARFMKSFFAQGHYLKDLEGYLSLSDSEILSALRKAAKDLSATGHLDADALMRREKRFKAISMKEGIGEAELKRLCSKLQIPTDALHLEISPFKEELHSPTELGTKGFYFPVQTRSGAIVAAEECSKISVPVVKVQWAYIAPRFEKAFREAVLQCS
jgi:HD superfamily phosphohydrolase